MATERSYYEILGVERSASDADIKRAFRKLAQKWHPDVSAESGAAERFKEINEAYQVLSDPQRRQIYDVVGKAGLGDMGGSGSPFGEGFPGFGDLFDAFFSGMGGPAGGPSRPAAGRSRTCATTSGSLSTRPSEASRRRSSSSCWIAAIPAAEAARRRAARPRRAPRAAAAVRSGASARRCSGRWSTSPPALAATAKARSWTRPARHAGAKDALARHKKIRVTIPAGIDEGHQIRLSGEGEAGPRGGPAGNLYVAVHVTPHATLRRDGTEIFHELPLSIAQAALGTRIRIPTIEGEEEIEVRPGTQPGTEIRLRGRGVPHLRRPGTRGDLHVMVRVNVPTKLSKKQRQLLEELAAESGEPVLPAGILDRMKDAIG